MNFHDLSLNFYLAKKYIFVNKNTKKENRIYVYYICVLFHIVLTACMPACLSILNKGHSIVIYIYTWPPKKFIKTF